MRYGFRGTQNKPLELWYPGEKIVKSAAWMVFGPDDVGQLRLKAWWRTPLNQEGLRECARHPEFYNVIVACDFGIEGMRYPEPAGFMWAPTPAGVYDFVGPLQINWTDAPNLRI